MKRISPALIFNMAFCLRLLSQRWRLSIRKVLPWSLGVIGYGSAICIILNPVTLSSYPPGARASSFTVPVTSSEDSWVRPAASSKSSSPTTAFSMMHWMIPVPSRIWRKMIFPLERMLYTQPLRSTSWPVNPPIPEISADIISITPQDPLWYEKSLKTPRLLYHRAEDL